MQVEKARDKADAQLEGARAQLAPYLAQRAHVREAAERMNAAVGGAYADPVAARRAIREFAEQAGIAATARELTKHPERFGAVRGTEVGPIRSAERRQALQQVEPLSRACADYLGKRVVAREQRDGFREARTAVREAETRVRALDSELGRTPGVAQLRLQIAEKVRSLQPQRRQKVNLRLSRVERLLLGASMAVGVAFLREQGHER